MKGKQLEIMRVIEFPKNKHVENIRRREKYQVAIKLLEILVDEGAEYHIVIDKEDALKIFDANEKLREYLIMTSDIEKAKILRLLRLEENASIYQIDGNEFD